MYYLLLFHVYYNYNKKIILKLFIIPYPSPTCGESIIKGLIKLMILNFNSEALKL